MGIFFTTSQPVLPAIQTVVHDALIFDPNQLQDVEGEAAKRTVAFAKGASPQFDPWRFGGAVAIAVVLLLAAIWTGKHDLPDISKSLMDSFSGFSGLVLGLLGGEAQKSP